MLAPQDLPAPPTVRQEREQYTKIQNGLLTVQNIDYLMPGSLDRMLSLFRKVDKLVGSGMVKYEHVLELYNIVVILTNRPELVFSCQLKPKTRLQKIE